MKYVLGNVNNDLENMIRRLGISGHRIDLFTLHTIFILHQFVSAKSPVSTTWNGAAVLNQSLGTIVRC